MAAEERERTGGETRGGEGRGGEGWETLDENLARAARRVGQSRPDRARNTIIPLMTELAAQSGSYDVSEAIRVDCVSVRRVRLSLRWFEEYVVPLRARSPNGPVFSASPVVNLLACLPPAPQPSPRLLLPFLLLLFSLPSS